jgi:uncharacterized protein DUF4153
MTSGAPFESGTIPELDAPEASRTTFLVIVALGAGFDLTFNGQLPGLAVPLFALILVGSFRSVARRSPSTDLLFVGSIILSVFPALHASIELAVVDILAASSLLGLAATQDVEPLATVTIVGLFRRGIALARRALGVPHYIAAPFASPAERGRARATLRVVLVAAPVIAVFAALLASGDRVFARVLSSILPKWNVGNILAHVLFVCFGGVLVAILWRSELGDGDEPRERAAMPSMPSLNFAEWATVLAGIDLLFAAFVVVQLTYLFGGHNRVHVTPGLTYAEYARTGFFQLTSAAALTVLVILAAWDAGRRDGRRHELSFRFLVTAMVSLTGVVLASALTRLALYEGTFGFTINRFFGYVGIVAIGAVLLVLLTGIWTGQRRRMIAGFLVVGVVALISVNVLDPERFVADRNVARFEATGAIDASYLGFELGLDAVPVAVDLLGRLPRAQADILRTALCERAENLEPDPSWRSLNLGRSSARRALSSAGIVATTCGNPSS